MQKSLHDSDNQTEKRAEKFDCPQMFFGDGQNQCFEFFDRKINNLFAHHAADIEFFDRFGQFFFRGGNNRFGQRFSGGANFFFGNMIGKFADRRGKKTINLFGENGIDNI